MKVIRIFLFSLSILSLKAWATESVFIEDQVYRVNVGNYGNFGTATLVRKKQKFYMTLPLRIVGASLFGLTSQREVERETDWTPNEKWFVKNARSFDDIPVLKAKVISYCKEIEQTFRTDFFELRLQIIFIEDEYAMVEQGRKQAAKYGNGRELNYEDKPTPGTLNLALMDTNKNNILATIIQPMPDQAHATPGMWDLYSEASIMAHELGHSLGIATEGYLYQDYPPNGLMGDEVSLNALKKLAPEIKRKILLMDFNTMMVGRGHGSEGLVQNEMEPEVDLDDALKEFTPTHNILKVHWPKDSYYDLAPDERRKLVEANVAKWLAQRRK